MRCKVAVWRTSLAYIQPGHADFVFQHPPLPQHLVLKTDAKNIKKRRSEHVMSKETGTKSNVPHNAWDRGATRNHLCIGTRSLRWRTPVQQTEHMAFLNTSIFPTFPPCPFNLRWTMLKQTTLLTGGDPLSTQSWKKSCFRSATSSARVPCDSDMKPAWSPPRRP